MARQQISPRVSRRSRPPGIRFVGWAVVGVLALLSTAEGGDILRHGTPAASNPTGVSEVGSGTPSTAAPVVLTPSDRLKVAAHAVDVVRQMQQAARNLASSGVATDPSRNPTLAPGSLRAGLTAVLPNSWNVANGLKPSTGAAWVGAKLPVNPDGTPLTPGTPTVTITQTNQTAVLNWDSFNIGLTTTLNFDQSAGGTNASQWIAFNKIGVTGNPSQILGSITAQGQVYIINPNGIIFGGSSQVNAHALVASSLPINDNLIQRGLLNNPDSQFLFSGVAQLGGGNGPTPGFTPLMTDEKVIAAGSSTATSTLKVSDLTSVTLTYSSSTGPQTLVANDDFQTTTTNGKAVVTLTTTGQAKVGTSPIAFAYTPAVTEYGDVTVQPGATLFAPTSADHVGGRVALIGPNVTNAGTLSAPDGQVILAAGLQVGMAAHNQTDPGLRGLDVYVGLVPDPATVGGYVAGTTINAGITGDPTKLQYTDASGAVIKGVIETTDLYPKNPDGTVAKNADGSLVAPIERPGAITMAGKEVDQYGLINSTTTVAFNGRIDLLANYNAFANNIELSTTQANQPFIYAAIDSTVPIDSAGLVKLGKGSLTQILPSTSTTDTVNRTQDQGLALPSEINLQGKAIYLASDVSATALTIPANAQWATILAPNATVNVQAGNWMVGAAGSINQFGSFLNSGGQVYLDPGAVIDVSGTQAAPASVTENVVSVQLLGSELRNSPLQRNGALRGQTVQVDLRVHGPWDQTLNNGAGGYTWVGTPLADAAGYVALVQRTAGELTTAGGNVQINAGGSVVMQNLSTIDVSGGWIKYSPGVIRTTQVSAGGHVYDISQATPDRVYDGIYSGTTTTTDPKWGVTQTNTNPLLTGVNDPGYDQGGNGGKVSLTAASVALDGNFVGQTYSGTKQILAQPVAGSNSLMALPSQFALKFSAQMIDPTNANTILDYSPTTPDVIFQSGAALAKSAPASLFVFSFDPTLNGANAALPTARQNQVDLSPDLVNKNGFGFVSIDTSDDNFGTNGRGAPTPPDTTPTVYGKITVPVNPVDPTQPLLSFGSASALAGYLNGYIDKSTPLASLNLTGANIDVAGAVASPGGILNFKAVDISPSLVAFDESHGQILITTADTTRGKVTLFPTAALSVAGAVVDYRQNSTAPDTGLNTAGGQILVSGFTVDVRPGSTMDVSGGATVSTTGKVAWGNAGKVSLVANNEGQFDGATLVLPASYTGDPSTPFALSGFSGAKGGELDLTTPLIQIGGAKANAATKLWLNPYLFSQGGFSTFAITGLTDASAPTTPALLIGSADPTADAAKDPVLIAPVVQRYQADLTQSGAAILQTYTPTDFTFRSSASLAFTAAQANGNKAQTGASPIASVILGNNAVIALLPNANSQVSLSGETVAVLGSVTVPGGKITVKGASDIAKLPGENGTKIAQVTVYLSPNSSLSTSTVGTVAATTTRDAQGNTVGAILAGGQITVRGNIVAEKGALLDASGTSGMLDLTPAQSSGGSPSSSTSGSTLVPTTVASDGGSITLDGGQELFSDATLAAKAGGSSALGGTLTIGSGSMVPNIANDSVVPTLLLTAPLPVTPTNPVPASDNTLPVSFFAQGKTAIGQTIVDAQNKIISIGGADATGNNYFGGHISTSSFATGGFDWLNLQGTVKYSGAVALTAGSGISVGTAGSVGTGGIIIADSQQPSSLSIHAPYVALGTSFASSANTQSFTPNGLAVPVYGTGTLSVSGAKLIDVGNLSLQNIGSASLTTAVGGDVRGSGTFDLAGKLTITAGQVYPPTATIFNIAAYDPTVVVPATDTTAATTAPVLDPVTGKPLLGSITFTRTGTPTQVPLSAGGQLNVSASLISQDGVLRAPLGSISLGGAGATSDPFTGSAFPTAQSITLGSDSVTSVSTVDLVTGKPLVEPIPYGVNLNSTSWIDPTGADITVKGAPAKQITITATHVTDQAGSKIDISGSGDLYAYRWVPGTNGTNDVLSSTTTSFAILPDYTAGYAPYGAFNGSAATDNLQGNPGYVFNPNLKVNVGDSLWLNLDGTGAKAYTLLPARYALLPGAYLVTPESGLPVGTVQQADGTRVISGYKYNVLDASRVPNSIYSNWEVAPNAVVLGNWPVTPSAVVAPRAEYDNSLANTFFPAAAITNNVAVAPLPVDGGQLVLNAAQSMTLSGTVNAQPAVKSDGTALGMGGQVDIASQEDILIAGPNTDLASATHELVLQSSELNNFGAASLLIGGVRSHTTNGTTVNVTTDNVIVDNGPGATGQPGVALTGSDIVLVANRAVEVTSGSAVQQSGLLPKGAEKLTLSGTVQLQPGETVGFARGGVPIAFPQGTGTNSFIASVDGVATDATGTQTTILAGATVVLTPGSTFTLAATQVDPSVGATLTVNTSVSLTPTSLAMVTGDGAALRVSSDPNAQIARTNVSLSSLTPSGVLAGSTTLPAQPGLLIAAGATVKGGTGSVILDATNRLVLPSDASQGTTPAVSGQSLSFGSRGISLVFDGSAGTAGTAILPNSVLQAPGATALSLLSYTSIDVYGSGTKIDTVGGTGLQNLSLHTAQIINKNAGQTSGSTLGQTPNPTGSKVTFAAVNVLLDNSAGGVPLATGTQAPSGILTIKAADATDTAGILQLGSKNATAPVNLDLFQTVNLSAGSGVLLQGTGGLNALGSDVTAQATTDLSIKAPVLGAAAGTVQTITAGGVLSLPSSGSPGVTAPSSGLGAKLTLVGASVDVGTQISLPSGQLTGHATSGDLTVSGQLDVSGRSKSFNDVTQYTGGGQISLVADHGAVTVASGGKLDVSAALDATKSDGSRLGDAGTISVSAIDPTTGQFVNSGTLSGQGGFTTAADTSNTAGKGGSFSLDVGQIADTGSGRSLQPLNDALNSGGFNLGRSIRVRSGDVLVDGTATAHTFNLSADNGSITVTDKGKIDASGDQNGTLNVLGKSSDAFGNHGGTIDLSASGSVILKSGADLTVAAANFDAAGKGGAITLAAGSSTNGVAPSTSTDTRDSTTGAFQSASTPVVDIQKGSTLDLSVTQTASLGDFQGTLHLRAPQTADGTDVQVNPLNGTILNPSSIVVEGYKVYDLKPAGGVIDTIESQINTNGKLFATTNADTIAGKLTANWSTTNPSLDSRTDILLHIQPGAEIINSAPLNAATVIPVFNPSGSTIAIPATGGSVLFPGGSGSSQVKSTISGTIVSAAGVATVLPASVNTTIPAGSTVTLNGAGTLSFTGSTTLTNVTVATGAVVTMGTAGSGTTIQADNSGRWLTLKAINSSITTTAASTSIAFPLGTPGVGATADKVKFSVAGTLTLADGTVSSFGANTTWTLAPGSMVTLNTPGVISFTSGTSGPIPLLLALNSKVNAKGVAMNTALGDLTLFSAWDLSAFRYGLYHTATVGSGEPGILTLRSTGNLIFNYDFNTAAKVLNAGSLSDGFDPSASPQNGGLWQAPLLAASSRSWAYNLIAGADLTAANVFQISPLSSLPATSGSVQVGYNAPAITTGLTGAAPTRTALIPQYYQTIRTGTGDITIAAGRDVQLLNSLATIYTAGTRIANPTTVVAPNDFDVPNTYYNKAPGGGSSGPIQNYSPASKVYVDYPTQYSYGGGDLTITAQRDITHLNADGTAYSTAEMPTNWLYRRGYVDTTGDFGIIQMKDPNIGSAAVPPEKASTSWWVDFSNFFEGVGALGGGNVALAAGRNVSNVDAVVPTNARMAKQVTTSTGTVDLLAAHQTLVELGGGNLNVQAAANIDAGVYYVERGTGTLAAGGSILTNATRSTLTATDLQGFTGSTVPDASTWLPTTLFLGKGSFNISAVNDITLGSVANVFLLPQGIDNSYYQRTFFSTFAPDDAVRVSSLQGDVTFKGAVNVQNNGNALDGSLYGWYTNILYNSTNKLAGKSQPWLQLIEGNRQALDLSFQAVASLMPDTLKVTAFSGSINLKDDLTLSPSPTGTIDLLATNSINALLPNSLHKDTAVLSSTNLYVWNTATINLSDANPSSVPSVFLPLGFWTDPKSNVQVQTPLNLLASTDVMFKESGSTGTPLQDQLALHGPNPNTAAGQPSEPLHGEDSMPLHLYASTGDISGLLLYSGKAANVIAGQDITDVGLYIQNARPDAVSVVAAGRDMILADANSTLRLQALATGDTSSPLFQQSGNIQISGPGTLEVFAGRNLNLGAAPTASPDGTPSLGITSIGDGRNPYLPFTGASIVAGAGIGIASGLDISQLDLLTFTAQFLNPLTGGTEAAKHLPELWQLMGNVIDDKNPLPSNNDIWSAFDKNLKLTDQQKSLLELQVFYLVLRDAGRDHNNATTAGFGNFNSGYEAIAALFGRRLDFTDATGTGFIDQFLNPTTGGSDAARYLPDLGKLLPVGSPGSNEQIWAAFNQLAKSDQEKLALNILSVVLTDAAQAQTQQATLAAGKAETAKAMAALLGGQQWSGNIALSSREIDTANGGDISLLAPGGGLNLGFDLPTDKLLAPPGILTEHGGNISIFTHTNVDVGVLRIFTLRGGNEIIWSSTGNIAAGKSSKTVQSAPPTQVLVDPQSANVKTDLAGLATGGGIGVLATVAGVKAGDVDLIAPVGAIDAGDAGIRASGNLNLAAQVVLNASNISVGGTSTGTPPPPPAPNLGSLNAASNSSASASSAANEVAKSNSATNHATELPSLITVEVLGYGGGDDDLSPASGPSDLNPSNGPDESEDEKKKRKQAGEGA